MSDPPARPRELQALADLRFHSNQMLPVFQLPNEVLTMVASHLKSNNSNADICNPKEYPIVSLSQTCRRWRNITLDPTCAGCWSTIPLKSNAWTRLCIARSRMSPISLQITDEFINALATTCPLVIPHLSRLHRVAVDFYELSDESDIPDQLWELLCHSAPHLSYMRIDFNSEVGTWVVLPSHLFAREEPSRLTSINLTFCDLEHTPHILHAPLTSLVLNNCAFWSDIDDMLACLRTMPTLEFLCATDCSLGAIESLTPRVITPLRSIPMPRLRTFQFEGIVIQAITVFQYIIAPVSVDITLSQWVRGAEDSTFDGLTRISNVLLAHFEPITAARIYPNHINLNGLDGVTVGWEYRLPVSFLEECNGLPPQHNTRDDTVSEFSIDLPFMDALTPVFFWPLATTLLVGVTSLKLSISNWRPRSARPLLHCFPLLRALTMEGAAMNILLRELGGATLHSILPYLETLEIVQTTFPGLLFSQFLAALPIRFSEHGQLRKLVITKCAVTSEHIDVLAMYLGNCEIAWDSES